MRGSAHRVAVAVAVLGLLVPRPAGKHVLLGHNGGTGGFRAFAGFMPATGVGVVALANDLCSVDRVGFAAHRAQHLDVPVPGHGWDHDRPIACQKLVSVMIRVQYERAFSAVPDRDSGSAATSTSSAFVTRSCTISPAARA